MKTEKNWIAITVEITQWNWRVAISWYGWLIAQLELMWEKDLNNKTKRLTKEGLKAAQQYPVTDKNVARWLNPCAVKL